MLSFLSLCLSALISGAFPILVSPYTADARLDTEVLVSEALFADAEGASGIVWPSAAEISVMDELGEYELGLEALAARWDADGRKSWLTAICCGKTTSQSLERIKRFNKIVSKYRINAAILGRLPNDIKNEAEMEAYFRSVAKISKLPFIIQTYNNNHSPQPSVNLLVRLAKEFPDIYGYYKEESPKWIVSDGRVREMNAHRDAVKTIFSGNGGMGFNYQGPYFGVRGIITQKPDCTRLLSTLCKRVEAGADASDPEFASAFGKMLMMDNLKLHFKGTKTAEMYRGPHLVILRELGIFKNTYTRKKSSGGKYYVENFEVTPSQLEYIQSLIRLVYGSDRAFDIDTAAAELNCSLEKVSEMVIPSSSLGCEKPVYSRIKKMADGGYILIYQGGRIGSNIYYNISYDLKNWGKSRRLFSAHPIVSELGEDERRYSSADATVLSNGDILVYVSARAHRAYRTSPASNYIALRRSSDNGKSWSDEQFIYNGTTWEPYILQLPSGKLQCYFTDSAPMIHSSGTSLIESSDNGYTWTPSGIGNCHKVIRQHRYASKDSAHIFTDQMPCVKVLKDGHTLLGFMESKIGDTYYLSLVRTVDDWKHLAQGELGPADRESNVIRGAAGYVSVFPSGEVVLSGNFNGLFKLKLGSADGRHFQGRDWSEGWTTAFSGRGYWGSTEIIGDDLLLATMHCAQGIQLATFRLKHNNGGAEISNPLAFF